MKCMIDRFKPYKIEGFKNDCRIVEENVMDVLDFLLALNFLARIVYDKKLKLIFEICDDDDDGCMTSEDILNMLQRVERVFAKESARVNLESSVLDNFVADSKAEHNFHFIMGMIKHQNL
jgi:Ca2+-binding EF-hand superfamily protein